MGRGKSFVLQMQGGERSLYPGKCLAMPGGQVSANLEEASSWTSGPSVRSLAFKSGTLELRSSGDASMELYSPELGQAWSAPSGCKPLTCSESGGPWNTKEEGAEQMVSLG